MQHLLLSLANYISIIFVICDLTIIWNVEKKGSILIFLVYAAVKQKKGYFAPKMPFSVWWDDKMQAWEAGKSHSKSTGFHTMHSWGPRSSVLFRCMAPAPWSLQQYGIDTAANYSINHSWIQQMCIAERHWYAGSFPCRYTFTLWMAELDEKKKFKPS